MTNATTNGMRKKTRTISIEVARFWAAAHPVITLFLWCAQVLKQLVDDFNASMCDDDQPQFVAQILHLLDLGERSVFVQIGQFIHHLRFVLVILLQKDARVRLV